MNLTTIWLIILVVCIVVELITMGLTTIWFAGGVSLCFGFRLCCLLLCGEAYYEASRIEG